MALSPNLQPLHALLLQLPPVPATFRGLFLGTIAFLPAGKASVLGNLSPLLPAACSHKWTSVGTKCPGLFPLDKRVPSLRCGLCPRTPQGIRPEHAPSWLLPSLPGFLQPRWFLLHNTHDPHPCPSACLWKNWPKQLFFIYYGQS